MVTPMSRIVILGATGSLGRHVLHQAIAAGHAVTVAVRTPSKLPPEIRARVSVHTADLTEAVPVEIVKGQDAVINCAGHVREGKTFVRLVDRLVSCVDALSTEEQPVCWFLAGAALLDLDREGRRGLDLPAVNATYWPHQANFDRLRRSRLDWRLLCPGPMIEAPPVGLDRLRISIDALPVQSPDLGHAPSEGELLPLFASHMPEMTVPYSDAAALMLANLDRGIAMARHRVGLALPVGMRAHKSG